MSMFDFKIVNKKWRHGHSWLAGQYNETYIVLLSLYIYLQLRNMVTGVCAQRLVVAARGTVKGSVLDEGVKKCSDC